LSGPRRIVFVARSFAGEGLRSARAITKLDNVELFVICERALETAKFSDLIYVADTHDADQLLAAAQQLQQKHGSLNRIVTTYETLLEPVAQTVEALGLEGMSVATVQRALNKSNLITTLREAGIGTARSRMCTDDAQVRRFAQRIAPMLAYAYDIDPYFAWARATLDGCFALLHKRFAFATAAR